MKGYRLWCTEPNSPKFIISRDVKFDESSMLHSKKEVVNTDDTPGVSKKVKLEAKKLEKEQECISN